MMTFLVVLCNPVNKGKRAETLSGCSLGTRMQQRRGRHIGKETVAAYQLAINWFPRLWFIHVVLEK